MSKVLKLTSYHSSVIQSLVEASTCKSKHVDLTAIADAVVVFSR